MPRVNDAVKWVEYDPQPEYGFPGSKGWESHELGAATNCALCTAAALITPTENINNPFWRKTAGIVNLDLQQELGHELGEEKLVEIWAQYLEDRQRNPSVEEDDSFEWKQWQRDDAFVVYARNEPSLKSQLRKMTDSDLQKLADQIIGLAGYVKKKLKTNVRYSSFPGGAAQNATTALKFMRDQPDDTKFAVFTAANLEYWPPHHWTYAEKQGGKVTFKDFQLDREGKPEPPASDLPLAPNGRKYKTETLGTTLMMVLAFGKNVVRGGEL